MFVSVPREDHPVFQEYAYHYWMSEAESKEGNYSEAVGHNEAKQSIARIAEHLFGRHVVGFMICEIDMIIGEYE